MRYCTDGPADLAKFGASTCESSYAGRVAAHKREDSIHYIALSLSTLGLEVGKRVVFWCSGTELVELVLFVLRLG